MDSIKVINRRTFPGGSIFELEFCDVGEESSKNNRFQWYLILNGTRYTLSFFEMIGEVRYLNYSVIRIVLDLARGVLIFGDTTYILDKS